MLVNGNDFYAENITFTNDWGIDAQNGPQALALLTRGDRSSFYNCSFRSFQDTWQTSSSMEYRSFAKNCHIEGAVNYIYGGGDCYFETCNLYCLRKGSVIVAPSHKRGTKWGYVFDHCTVDSNDLAKNGGNKLGCPWHGFPLTVFLNTKLKAPIAPEGWNDMGGFPQVFAEYNSVDAQGSLVDLKNRKTSYKGKDIPDTLIYSKAILTADDAAKYTYSAVTKGTDGWNPRVYSETVAIPAKLIISGNKLSWSPSMAAIGYVIFRGNEVIGFTVVPSFVDQTAQKGKNYQYQVRAVNEFGSVSQISDIAKK